MLSKANVRVVSGNAVVDGAAPLRCKCESALVPITGMFVISLVYSCNVVDDLAILIVFSS